MTKKLYLLLTSFLLMVITAGSAHAAPSYDPYAPEYSKTPQSAGVFKKAVNNFLVLPFRLIKWPVAKTLLAVEKNHLEKKALWIYDNIKEYGYSPHLNIVNPSDLGAGVDVDLVRVARLRDYYPDATADAWFHWTDDVYLKTGAKIGLERIGGTGLRAFQSFAYENRPNEHFYGIGPNTSAGDGAVYSQETTEIKTTVGFSDGPVLSADAFFAYKNINISSGHDGGRGQRGEIPTFSFERTPGIFGDSLVSAGFEMKHDTRNQKQNSTRGGLKRLAWSYNEGLNSSDARYFKYEAELSHYIRLGSDRRVLALHFVGEHHDEISNGSVPFHRMSKLGGYGLGSRESQPLRGYAFNRFFDESVVAFNVEYRYTIWQYREFKGDAVFFWDEGQVFGEFSEMQLSDFRESYGVGLRFSLANVSLLSLEFAHGDEGSDFYVKTRTAF